MMAIAVIIPVAKWLAKIKQRSDVRCRLCKRAREQRGASTENLPEEMYGHINSAFCDGIATTHHFIWRHLYASMQAAQTPTSKLRVVTPDKESNMSTLWQEEEFKQICSRELLTEKVADIEKTIAVKKHERERYDLDPTMFYENRFWNRRPDGMAYSSLTAHLMLPCCHHAFQRTDCPLPPFLSVFSPILGLACLLRFEKFSFPSTSNGR